MSTPPSYICFVSSSDDQDLCIYNDDIKIDHASTHAIQDYSDENCSSDDVMLIQTVPLDYKNYQDDQEQEKKMKNELFAMKIKMEKQQEKINILSSKLYAVKNENEEVLRHHHQHKHQQENDICKEGTYQDDKQNEEPGTKLLQFVIDTNAKLIADNVRLQGLVDVTRKSFTSIRRRRRRRSSSVSTRSDDSVNIMMIDTPQDVTKSSSIKTQDEDRDEKNDDGMIVDFGERRRLCRVSSTARMA